MNHSVMKASTAFAIGWLACQSVLASGPTISDKQLCFTLTLPAGFESVPKVSDSPETRDIKYAFKRMNPDGESAILVLVQNLGGTITPKHAQPGEVKKMGGFGVYREMWESFDLDVAMVRETRGGVYYMTRNVQIPIKPCAIQLTIFGLESQDAEMALVTRQLLASFKGTRSLTQDDSSPRAMGAAGFKIVITLVVIGSIVQSLTNWSTRRFRCKALQGGIPVEIASQKIRPSWIWYLLSAYMFFASVIGAAIGVVYLDGLSTWFSEALACCCAITSLAIAVSAMRSRIGVKRQILASAVSSCVLAV